MVLKPHQAAIETWRWFENDVKMYGTQTDKNELTAMTAFENDVKMYGTQTECEEDTELTKFENDVKMYRTQTPSQCGMMPFPV